MSSWAAMAHQQYRARGGWLQQQCRARRSEVQRLLSEYPWHRHCSARSTTKMMIIGGSLPKAPQRWRPRAPGHVGQPAFRRGACRARSTPCQVGGWLLSRNVSPVVVPTVKVKPALCAPIETGCCVADHASLPCDLRTVRKSVISQSVTTTAAGHQPATTVWRTEPEADVAEPRRQPMILEQWAVAASRSVEVSPSPTAIPPGTTWYRKSACRRSYGPRQGHEGLEQ
jgi:hypothetical protein